MCLLLPVRRHPATGSSWPVAAVADVMRNVRVREHDKRFPHTQRVGTAYGLTPGLVSSPPRLPVGSLFDGAAKVIDATLSQP
jgi:hypothetical protein